MEVLLAKKRLNDRRATASSGVGSQKIIQGSRIIVREGREFAAFRAGDEGWVLSVDEDAARCEVHFDGSDIPVTVALRHVNGIAEGSASRPSRATIRQSSPSRASNVESSTSQFGLSIDSKPVSSSSVICKPTGGSGKRAVARFKTLKDPALPRERRETSRSASPERDFQVAGRVALNVQMENLSRTSLVENNPGTPPAPMVPATWQCGMGEGPQERSPNCPSESVTELLEPTGTVASLRRALQQCAGAIEANLRVVDALTVDRAFQASSFNEDGRVISLSAAEYQDWQQSLTALRNAAESSMNLMCQVPTPKKIDTSIEVPVETVGYRHPPQWALPPSPTRGQTQPVYRAPSLVPRATIARSTSAPVLNTGPFFAAYPSASSMVVPISPSGLFPAPPGPEAILSPRVVSSSTIPSLNLPIGNSPGPMPAMPVGTSPRFMGVTSAPTLLSQPGSATFTPSLPSLAEQPMAMLSPRGCPSLPSFAPINVAARPPWDANSVPGGSVPMPEWYRAYGSSMRAQSVPPMRILHSDEQPRTRGTNEMHTTDGVNDHTTPKNTKTRRPTTRRNNASSATSFSSWIASEFGHSHLISGGDSDHEDDHGHHKRAQHGH